MNLYRPQHRRARELREEGEALRLRLSESRTAQEADDLREELYETHRQHWMCGTDEDF